ncbi:hypothetical protein [Sphingomonas mollis]|uniref:Uncharacterized protein n=1 Tax=Sphingomonas mollis TaxID=2795726 RepID=A0ABS0XUM7_9SPHN|nr:hypothetical protein [Sphingomonas sp. BT553]MBJ6123453.1 hypothetical protein [Sphingomonas sp. BT553]
MHRYAETLNALNIALNLMIEEGDTCRVASISHPLHMAENQLMLRRAEMLTASIAARSMSQPNQTTVQTSQ